MDKFSIVTAARPSAAIILAIIIIRRILEGASGSAANRIEVVDLPIMESGGTAGVTGPYNSSPGSEALRV